MGNWCHVPQVEPEIQLPQDPGYVLRVLARHSETVVSLQSCIRAFRLRSQLQRQLLLLPVSPDSDPYSPVTSPDPIIPPLSAAAHALMQTLPDFNYDLPLLCVTQKPATSLSDQSVYVGGWHQGKRYGQGVCYQDGGVQEGYWTSGLLHYQGRMIWSDGSSYEGGFDMMRRHGYGVHVSRDGQEIYKGEWRVGVKHGKAEETRRGVVYKGWFEEGEKTGTNVVLEWPNRDRYEGDMVRGKKHGRGKFTCGNSGEYEGDWVKDVQEGTGHWTNGQEEYAGQFKDGVRQGRGVLRWSKFEYEGEFDADMMHGEGWFTQNGLRRLFRFDRNQRGPELSTDTHQPLRPV